MSKLDIQDLALKFLDSANIDGFSFDCLIIPSEVEVLQITLNDLEEVSVYLSMTDEQILCICYLWHEDEINGSKKAELMETMLELNVPMPLSSFAKIGDRYTIFGALSSQSTFDDIAHEVVVLVENAVEAMAALEGYLK